MCPHDGRESVRPHSRACPPAAHRECLRYLGTETEDRVSTASRRSPGAFRQRRLWPARKTRLSCVRLSTPIATGVLSLCPACRGALASADPEHLGSPESPDGSRFHDSRSRLARSKRTPCKDC